MKSSLQGYYSSRHLLHRRNWKAKVGPSIRLLRALTDYLIEWQIEIIPTFVRSGRNFSRDHLPRKDEQGIAERARIMNMKPAEIHESWFTLVDSWKREVEFLDLDRFATQRTLRSFGRRIIGCEWRPGTYGFSASLGTIGGKCFCEEPLHSNAQRQMATYLSRMEWRSYRFDVRNGVVGI